MIVPAIFISAAPANAGSPGQPQPPAPKPKPRAEGTGNSGINDHNSASGSGGVTGNEKPNTPPHGHAGEENHNATTGSGGNVAPPPKPGETPPGTPDPHGHPAPPAPVPPSEPQPPTPPNSHEGEPGTPVPPSSGSSSQPSTFKLDYTVGDKTSMPTKEQVLEVLKQIFNSQGQMSEKTPAQANVDIYNNGTSNGNTNSNGFKNFTINGYEFKILSNSNDNLGVTSPNHSGAKLLYYQLAKNGVAKSDIENVYVDGFKTEQNRYSNLQDAIQWILTYANYSLNPTINPLYKNINHLALTLADNIFLAGTNEIGNPSALNEINKQAPFIYQIYNTLKSSKQTLDNLESENLTLKETYIKVPVDKLYKVIDKSKKQQALNDEEKQILKDFIASFNVPEDAEFNIVSYAITPDNQLALTYTLSPKNEADVSESPIFALHSLPKTILVSENESQSVKELEDIIKTISTKMASLIQENTKLSTNLADLSKEYGIMQDTLEQITKAFKQKLADKDKAYSMLEDTLAKIVATFKTQKMNLDTLINKQNEDLNAKGEAYNELNKQYLALNDILNDLKTLKDNLLAKYNSKEKDYDKLAKDYAMLEDTFEKVVKQFKLQITLLESKKTNVVVSYKIPMLIFLWLDVILLAMLITSIGYHYYLKKDQKAEK